MSDTQDAKEREDFYIAATREAQQVASAALDRIAELEAALAEAQRDAALGSVFHDYRVESVEVTG